VTTKGIRGSNEIKNVNKIKDEMASCCVLGGFTQPSEASRIKSGGFLKKKKRSETCISREAAKQRESGGKPQKLTP